MGGFCAGGGVRLLFGCCCFFQGEDGIRDGTVTGVQTCALPISLAHGAAHIEQEVNVHLLLGGKELEEETLQSAVGVPIDVTEIIASVIFPVTGKFEAETLPERGVLPPGARPREPFRNQPKSLQFLKKLRLQKGRGAFRRHLYKTSGTRSSTSAKTFSGLIPSASASRLSMIRWPRPGSTTERMSSKETLGLAERRERALAARIKLCNPLGLEP